MRRAFAIAVLAAALPIHAQTFRPEAIRAHMSFLASDLLEGRGSGTRGYQIAAEYVAAQYEAAGLAPGAGNSYFQAVPLRRTFADPASTIVVRPDSGAPRTLRYGEEFVTSGNPLVADRTVEGRLVVVGHGVTAPERNYDDYAGIDVRGKVVIVFNGAPSSFPDTLRAHYSSSLNKIANAGEHGASGMIVVDTPEDAERAPWTRIVRQNKLGAMHWLEASGAPHAVRTDISNTNALGPAGIEALFGIGPRTFADASADVKAGRFRAFEIPARVSIHTISRHEQLESPNVVGLLRGSDPKLRDEYLVYSSHLDHLGISSPVDGDTINNGALDNASGIAAIVEIARAFGSKAAPKRSILFLATTAEEKGLRGADYFANNPTVPSPQVVGNINIDEIMMIDDVKDIVPLGIEVSTLGDMARDVAKEMKLQISPDPYPEEVYFVRSDQYPFVRAGVPALFLCSGYVAVDPKVDAKAHQLQWIKTIYHTPKDDMEQPLDFTNGAVIARFGYLLGVKAANAAAAPAWTPGNFFGEKFGRK